MPPDILQRLKLLVHRLRTPRGWLSFLLLGRSSPCRALRRLTSQIKNLHPTKNRTPETTLDYPIWRRAKYWRPGMWRLMATKPARRPAIPRLHWLPNLKNAKLGVLPRMLQPSLRLWIAVMFINVVQRWYRHGQPFRLSDS